jgi:hypothetical protein
MIMELNFYIENVFQDNWNHRLYISLREKRYRQMHGLLRSDSEMTMILTPGLQWPVPS